MRKQFLVLILGLFLLMICGAPALHAQLGIRRLNITVTDTSGAGIPDVKIKVTCPDVSGLKVEEKTNKKGLATVSLLEEAKKINLYMEKEGYQPLKTEEPFSVKLGTTDKTYVMYRNDEMTPEQKKEVDEKQHEATADFNKGIELFEAGNFKDCIDEFNKALEIRPDWLEAYQNLSAAYFRLENYEKAIEYAKKTLELDPKLVQSVRLLTVAYSKLGDEKTARMYEEKLRKMEGVKISAEEYFNMGAVAANEHNDQQALEHFKKAVEVKPDYAEAHYQLALCMIRLGKTEEAVPELQKYLEIAPDGKDAANTKQLLQAFSKTK
jgi:tetratricopeptide (TPR) repeat protein